MRVKNLKDAKRLMSRLLVAFQRGDTDNRDAKDLAYLLSVYVQIVKDSEIEERIAMLEERIAL
jgi:predicted nucleotidyltransferase